MHRKTNFKIVQPNQLFESAYETSKDYLADRR
jgi:hypothetical protein